MKRALTLTTALAALAAAAASSVLAGTPAPATLVIQHQVRGCHTWSVNGGALEVT